MSYLFLYQNYKHQLQSWDYRRKNLSSTYGQFDMPMLRKSLKDRFVLHGHGTHPLHKLFYSLGLEDKFTGHVVEIEDSKIAVWLKLNYDHISRKDHNYGHELKYIGCYKDVKVEDLEPQIAQVANVGQRITALESERQRLRMLNDTVTRAITGGDTQYPNLPAKSFEGMLSLSNTIDATMNIINNKLNLLDIERKDIKREALNYLDDHRLS